MESGFANCATMCYMEKKRQVGVRELRQDLSKYLGRVAETGETYEVTDHGRPVAVLGPLPQPSTPLQRLIASGRATAPKGDLLELGPPPGRASRRASRALKRALEEIREDRL
jgi:prevent-host-death family protein